MKGLTCQELIGFLGAYLEGEVSEEERGSFDAHLAACPHCVAYLDSYRQAGTLLRQAFSCDSEELPPEVPPDLVKAVLASRAG